MPFEVSMRNFPCPFFQVDQQGRECVCNHWTLRATDSMSSDTLAADSQMIFEFRSVARLDFENIYTFTRAEGMLHPHLAIHNVQLCFFPSALWPAGNDTDDPVIVVS
jgi:hypothetical protein